jgi:hypothetical protein
LQGALPGIFLFLVTLTSLAAGYLTSTTTPFYAFIHLETFFFGRRERFQMFVLNFFPSLRRWLIPGRPQSSRRRCSPCHPALPRPLCRPSSDLGLLPRNQYSSHRCLLLVQCFLEFHGQTGYHCLMLASNAVCFTLQWSFYSQTLFSNLNHNLPGTSDKRVNLCVTMKILHTGPSRILGVSQPTSPQISSSLPI